MNWIEKEEKQRGGYKQFINFALGVSFWMKNT